MQKDEREQIREKRSSLFNGRRRVRKIVSKEIIIGVLFLIVLSLVFVAPNFWNAANKKTTLSTEQAMKTPVTPPGETSSSTGQTPSPTPSPTTKITPKNKISPISTPVNSVIGKIGIPQEKNGFEITVKSVSPSSIRTIVWIVAKNTGSTERPLNLSPKPVIIDDSGNQYENLIVERSGLNQRDLYPKAKREGAIFFDGLKEGTKAQILIFYVNGTRFDFSLDGKNNS